MLLPDKIEIDPKWLPIFGSAAALERFYLPVRRDGDTVRLPVRFSRREKNILRKKRQIPVSEWAERHRVLPRDAARPGKWRNANVPYMAGVMDAAFFPSVQEIIVCAAAQAAKTEAVYTCMGYTMDRRPGSWMVVFPKETDAKDNARDRLIPMINDSPVLRKLKTGYMDDETGIKITLQHMRIYMAWASSPARLANRPIPYVYLDEEDKYPATASRTEASPSNLAKKRMRTYGHMRKIFRTSSPSVAAGPIWRALTEECQLVFDYWVQCPFCAGHQKMDFDNIRWPAGERDPNRIKETQDVWYECPVCDAKWDDADRDRAVRSGQWRDRGHGRAIDAALKSIHPITIGFHIPAWLSPFVQLWECAAAFLKGYNFGRTDWNELKDFRNGFAAEPWEIKESVRLEAAIVKLKDERPPGLVPSGNVVQTLLAGIDTHGDDADGRLDYEIRAFGYGHAPTTWSIRCGHLNSLAALKTVLWEDKYYDADGRIYSVRLACIDAMGHRTAEIYNFCRMNSGIIACKGEQTMSRPFRDGKLTVYPGTNKPIAGGVVLYRHNTNFFKNKLAAMLKVNPGDPGSWYYHSGLDDDWARQMCAETVNPKTQLWENIGGKDNHAWDVSVLELLAYEVLDLCRHQPPQEASPPPPDADRRDAVKWLDRKEFERPKWLRDR